MIIIKDSELPEEFMKEEGVNNVLKRVLIGPEHGSSNIIMRYFKVLPGGNTPLHSHSHEHVVKIEKGRGVVIDEEGEENMVGQGQSLFIEGGNQHQFRNFYDEPFEFLCIILNPDKK
ncbi:MAG: cupin domain-containing protein [Candidatus Aminicenantaceae bacterium]